MARDREGDRARARAGVGDAHEAARVGVLVDRGERSLDEGLRLRAGYEAAQTDLERQSVELAPPEDVRERFVREPSQE